MRYCTINECKRKYNARGFCGMHYSRLKKMGLMPVIQPHVSPNVYVRCSRDDCDGKHFSKGLCQLHYDLKRKKDSPVYRIWVGMKQRCFDSNHHSYPYYGGRGIDVCDEWANSFTSFYEHIGDRPSRGHSVDRINVNGNYEPGNVRWATAVEQANNKRSSPQYKI